MILKLIMPETHWLQDRESCCFLLAIVSDCDTSGKDATKELVTFTTNSLPCTIVDLNAICAMVGYFKYGAVDEKWAVVDQSTDWTLKKMTWNSVIMRIRKILYFSYDL